MKRKLFLLSLFAVALLGSMVLQEISFMKPAGSSESLAFGTAKADFDLPKLSKMDGVSSAPMGKPRVRFLANRGQLAERYFLSSDGGRLRAFFARDRVRFSRPSSIFDGDPPALFEVEWVGAQTQWVSGADRLRGVVNLYRGSDPRKWYESIPTFAGVWYEELYPGIDLEFRTQQANHKSQFLVAPGADPSRIAMRYLGVEALELGPDGSLVIKTATDTFIETAPKLYQETLFGLREVKGNFLLEASNHTVRISVGPYDRSLPLVIDPYIMVSSSYLGGSDNDHGRAIAFNVNGETILVGLTRSDLDFPLENPAQPNIGGIRFVGDIFVTQTDPQGNELIFSTYLGGTNDEVGEDVTVGADGRIHLVGWTASEDDFPEINPLPTAGSGTDIFLASFSASGALTFSTRIGGSQTDRGFGIAIDQEGALYVAGSAGPGFPTVNAYQPAYQGGPSDGILFKLNSERTSLEYSTYIGGGEDDEAHSVAVNAAGEAHVVGVTSSDDFLVFQPFQAERAGASDAFFLYVDKNGQLFRSSFLGGSSFEESSDARRWKIDLDPESNSYITGTSHSNDYPLVSPIQDTKGGISDIVITVVNSDGSELLFSTFLGGSDRDEGAGIETVGVGSFTVSAHSRSADFPLGNPPKPNFGVLMTFNPKGEDFPCPVQPRTCSPDCGQAGLPIELSDFALTKFSNPEQTQDVAARIVRAADTGQSIGLAGMVGWTRQPDENSNDAFVVVFETDYRESNCDLGLDGVFIPETPEGPGLPGAPLVANEPFTFRVELQNEFLEAIEVSLEVTPSSQLEIETDQPECERLEFTYKCLVPVGARETAGLNFRALATDPTLHRVSVVASYDDPRGSSRTQSRAFERRAGTRVRLFEEIDNAIAERIAELESEASFVLAEDFGSQGLPSTETLELTGTDIKVVINGLQPDLSPTTLEDLTLQIIGASDFSLTGVTLDGGSTIFVDVDNLLLDRVGVMNTDVGNMMMCTDGECSAELRETSCSEVSGPCNLTGGGLTLHLSQANQFGPDSGSAVCTLGDSEENRVFVDPQQRFDVRFTSVDLGEAGISMNSVGGRSVQELVEIWRGIAPTACDGPSPLIRRPAPITTPVLFVPAPLQGLSASGDAPVPLIRGTIVSGAESEIRLDFYLSDRCNPDGFSPAQNYLQSSTLMTDSTGHGEFEVVLEGEVPADHFVTTIATGPDGSTEFSSCAPVSGLPAPVSTGYIPYFKSGGQDFTGLAISNFGLETAQVEFLGRNALGGLSSGAQNPATTDLNPGSQSALTATQILGLQRADSGWIELTSNRQTLGSFFQFGDLGLNQLDGGTAVAEVAQRLAFTRVFDGLEVFRGQTTTTELTLLNPSTSVVDARLTYFSGSQPAGSQEVVHLAQIPPRGYLRRSAGDIFAQALSGGWIEVETISGPGLIGFAVITPSEEATVLGLNAAVPDEATEAFSAQLASGPDIFTNVSLVNTASEVLDVELRAISADGSDLGSPLALSLAPDESVAIDAVDIFSTTASVSVNGATNVAGSLQVTTDTPGLIGDVVFGAPDRLSFAAALPLQTQAFTEAIFSQVGNVPGSFFTGVAFFNPSEEEVQITIEVVGADGVEVGSKEFTLVAKGRTSPLLTELVPESEGQSGGYIRVVSSAPIIGQELFGGIGSTGLNLLSAVPPTVVQ